MKRKRIKKIFCFFLLHINLPADPFPDYGGILIDILTNKEFILCASFVGILYVNRLCWKTSYETTYGLRSKYENLYLDETAKVLRLQIENSRLKKEICELKGCEKKQVKKMALGHGYPLKRLNSIYK